MRSIVSIATDITHGTLIDYSIHYQVGPTIIPAILAPQREAAVPVRNKPADYEHSFAETVLHRGQAIMVWDHGCGFGIDHAGLIPNALSPLHKLQSSRDANFFSTSVQMGGSNTAFAIMLRLPPCPMQVCGDPLTLPLGTADSDSNTVIVGIPLLDYFQQVAVVLGNLVVDLLEIRKSVMDIIATEGAAAPLEILSNLIGYPLSGAEDYLRVLRRAAIFNIPSLLRAILTNDPVVLKVSVGKGHLKTEIKVVRNSSGVWTVVGHVPVVGGVSVFSTAPAPAPAPAPGGAGGASGASPNDGAFPQPGVGSGGSSGVDAGGAEGSSGAGGGGGAGGSSGAGGAPGTAPNEGAFPQPNTPSSDAGTTSSSSSEDPPIESTAPLPGFDPL